MDSRRKPTPKSNPKSKSAGSSSKIAGSISRSAGSTSKSAGSILDLRKDVQMYGKEMVHEVEVKYTGLPTTCKNCGITFGSYVEYYSHLVYSQQNHQLPLQTPVDLELKLAVNNQPTVDLELRLSPPANQKN